MVRLLLVSVVRYWAVAVPCLILSAEGQAQVPWIASQGTNALLAQKATTATFDFTNPTNVKNTNIPFTNGPYSGDFYASGGICGALYNQPNAIGSIFQNVCGTIASNVGATDFGVYQFAQTPQPKASVLFGPAPPSSATITLLNSSISTVTAPGQFCRTTTPPYECTPISPPPAPPLSMPFYVSYSTMSFTTSAVASSDTGCTLNGSLPIIVSSNVKYPASYLQLGGGLTVNENSYTAEFSLPFVPGPQTLKVDCPNSALLEVFSAESGVTWDIAYSDGGIVPVAYQSVYRSSTEAAGATLMTGAQITSGPPSSFIFAGKLIPVQVIGNPMLPPNVGTRNFDFVVGKSASFRVELGVDSNLQFAAGSIQLYIMDGLTDSTSVPISVSDPIQLSDLNSAAFFPPIGDTQPFGAAAVYAEQFHAINSPNSWVATQGTHNLWVKIDASNATTNVFGITRTFGDPTTPNASATILTHVVVPPKIGFASITDAAMCKYATGACSTSPNSSNFSKLLSTDSFVSAIFPVPDMSVKYNGSLVSPIISPVTAPTQTEDDFATDIMNLETQRLLVSGKDRMVGIVSKSYFPRHGFDHLTGMSHSWNTPSGTRVAKSVLASELAPVVVPHELAHTFGVVYEEYCYNGNSNPQCVGLPPNAYDNTIIDGNDNLAKKTFVWPVPDVTDPFRNPFETTAISIMGPTDFQSGNLGAYWIDDRAYSILLAKLLSAAPLDPPTTLISGVLNKNGTFKFGPSVNLPNGVVTAPDVGGDITFNILDSAGKNLGSVTIQSGFSAIVAYDDPATAGPPIIETNTMPVTIQVPQNTAIESIQVLKGGQIIQKTTASSQLLQGLILNFPDDAFRIACHHKNETEQEEQRVADAIAAERAELNNLVIKIQTKMNSIKPREAIGPMHELIEKIEQKTMNYLIPDGSAQLTRTEVLSELRAILGKLEQLNNKDKNENSNHKDGKEW